MAFRGVIRSRPSVWRAVNPAVYSPLSASVSAKSVFSIVNTRPELRSIGHIMDVQYTTAHLKGTTMVVPDHNLQSDRIGNLEKYESYHSSDFGRTHSLSDEHNLF